MNKQAAKLAKTTALLNSTSIQLRISGSFELVATDGENMMGAPVRMAFFVTMDGEEAIFFSLKC